MGFGSRLQRECIEEYFDDNYVALSGPNFASEIMLRLSTSGQTRFVQSNSFDVCYGGGEANVALSLSNYGNETIFVTKRVE